MKRIALVALLVGLAAAVGCGKSRTDEIVVDRGSHAPKGGPKRLAKVGDEPKSRIVMPPLKRAN